MKHLFYLFLLTIFLACEASKVNEEQSEAIENQIVTRLNYEGEKPQKIVLVSGDEEYRSEEALPQLAKILNTHHGFNCTVLFAQNPNELGIVDPNYTQNIPGLEALDDADLLVLFTRFRELPDAQMQHFDRYLKAGKPIINLRTSTHAFHFTDTTHQWKYWGNYFEEEGSEWNGGFGRVVSGESWHTHHGHHKNQSTRGRLAMEHSITNGIEDGEIWGSTDVYGVRLPLPGDTQPLVLGEVVDRDGDYQENDLYYGMRESDAKIATVNPAEKEAYNPNEPMMPIAWIRTYQLPDGKSGTSFTSTIGASADLMNEAVRRLLVNATYFLLDEEVPTSAKVDLVGQYEPTQYQFHDDAYWDERAIKIEDLQ